MRLDRNINANGRGKYALIKLRAIPHDPDWGGIPRGIWNAIRTLENAGVWDWGHTEDSEFFVIRLKDVNAAQGLAAYADSAELYDPEWAAEVRGLAKRTSRRTSTPLSP